jgi:hypothetical protein
MPNSIGPIQLRGSGDASAQPANVEICGKTRSVLKASSAALWTIEACADYTCGMSDETKSKMAAANPPLPRVTFDIARTYDCTDDLPLDNPTTKHVSISCDNTSHTACAQWEVGAGDYTITASLYFSNTNTPDDSVTAYARLTNCIEVLRCNSAMVVRDIGNGKYGVSIPVRYDFREDPVPTYAHIRGTLEYDQSKHPGLPAVTVMTGDLAGIGLPYQGRVNLNFEVGAGKTFTILTELYNVNIADKNCDAVSCGPINT